MLAIFGVAALIVVACLIVGTDSSLFPTEGIQKYIPIPHVQLTFGGVKNQETFDYAGPFREAGYNVDFGTLVPLSFGTCLQCMGSPGFENPHLAVAFSESEGTSPSCAYNGTGLGVCFHLDKSEALIIITQGPKKDTFDEFSWGVYLYDRLETGGRDLIQAPLYDPLRLEKEGLVVIVITYMPDIADVLVGAIQMPDLDLGNTYILPIPGDLVQTDKGPKNDDRLAVLLKSIPKDTSEYFALQQTTIMRLKMPTNDLRAKVRKGHTYKNKLGVFTTKVGSELTLLGPLVRQTVEEIKAEHNVLSEFRMITLRNLLGTFGIQDCIALDMNCLAEDWDVAFSVSGRLYFPETPDYKFAVVGVDHAEASHTTAGLFNVILNQQVVSLPKIDEQGGVYVRWFARDCSQSPQPCTAVPFQVTPNATELFLKEHVYGVRSYENLVLPIVLKIKSSL